MGELVTLASRTALYSLDYSAAQQELLMSMAKPIKTAKVEEQIATSKNFLQ